MKTELNLVAAGLFLATLATGFGQPVIITQPQSCTNIQYDLSYSRTNPH